ncbi:hypothetical protein [Sphingomonas sp. KR3-1]|uniref:BPSS1187 family protein n=1 Tax=Sphingomonas sp. KR3-1 TaxID=3156611 RepID=UPI0032B3D50F
MLAVAGCSTGGGGPVNLPTPSPSPSASPSPTPSPSPSPTGTADITRHDIAVTTVDASAVQANNAQTGVPNRNLVLVPTSPAARKGRLALFITGTNSTEVKEQEIGEAGARRGYHAITIAYPNWNAVAVLCTGVLDDECTAKVREEILTGVDLSDRIAVAPQDALEPRLQKLLAYLAATYPAEGWGSFLAGGAVNWPLVSAIGHSQGAGHVAYLAKRHALYRAVMLSGVADVTATGQTAPWLSRANVTPAASQYGFSHTADMTVPIAIADASWRAIGLAAFGALTTTDGAAVPFGGSHRLTTSLPAVGGTNIHLSMADDDKMPRNADGTPAYAPVWDFTAFP